MIQHDKSSLNPEYKYYSSRLPSARYIYHTYIRCISSKTTGHGDSAESLPTDWKCHSNWRLKNHDHEQIITVIHRFLQLWTFWNQKLFTYFVGICLYRLNSLSVQSKCRRESCKLFFPLLAIFLRTRFQLITFNGLFFHFISFLKKVVNHVNNFILIFEMLTVFYLKKFLSSKFIYSTCNPDNHNR